MENNQKSCMYLMYEVRQSMEQSLKSIDEVSASQDELANIIVSAKNKKHNFKDLVKDLKAEVQGYKNQKTVINEKLELVNNLIAIHQAGHKEDATEEAKKNADFIEQTVTTLALILGMVKTDTELNIEKQKAEDEKRQLEERKKELAKNVQADNVQ